MTAGGVPARHRIRLWAALGALVLVGGTAGLVVSASSPVAYTATATSYVASQNPKTVDDHAPGDPFTQQVRQSYASIATTQIVLDPVISTLGLRTTAQQLAKRVHTDIDADTVLLRISAIDGSASQSAAIANAVQAELARQVRQLTPSTGGTPTSELTSVRTAQVPTRPSSPNVLLDLAVGALGGAGVWLLAVLVRAIRRLRPPASGGLAAPSML